MIFMKIIQNCFKFRYFLKLIKNYSKNEILKIEFYEKIVKK